MLHDSIHISTREHAPAMSLENVHAGEVGEGRLAGDHAGRCSASTFTGLSLTASAAHRPRARCIDDDPAASGLNRNATVDRKRQIPTLV
jgi:hypothetical protein